RPDGRDHPFGGQVEAGGQAGFAGQAAAVAAIAFAQLRTRGPVDGAVHPATAEQRFVRRIDDGVDLDLRDVTLVYADHARLPGGADQKTFSAKAPKAHEGKRKRMVG